MLGFREDGHSAQTNPLAAKRVMLLPNRLLGIDDAPYGSPGMRGNHIQFKPDPKVVVHGSYAQSGSNLVSSGSQWTLGGFKPANNELGSSVRQSAQDPMNTHSFFFSFDSVLPGEASKPASGGLPSWGRPSLKKTLAVPVFIVQNDRAWS